MDGRETVVNGMGRAPLGRSDTEATRETVGNSLGRAHGGKERYGSDERVDRRETVGNRLGRGPVGRSDTGVTTTLWEIARGELRLEEAI